MNESCSAQKLLMLDLFAGKGGASQAMREAGWDVITVEINPDFTPDIVADISEYHYEGPTPDLIWASPPCTEFSKWDKPDTWSCNKGGKKRPDMSLVLKTKEIIDEVQPRWWVVENVRGAIEFFNPVFGPYRKKSGSRYLWGEFPIFDCDPAYGKWLLPPTKDRPALRSLIPSQISRGLCLAIAQNGKENEVRE